MSVLGCIIYRHNLWLVVVALLICGAGSWVTARLVLRAFATRSLQRFGWSFIAAVVAAADIWCTHFVAMLGFEPGVPIAFDPVLTIASLLIALVGSIAGFVLATSRVSRAAPALGGAIVGLAVALMHYAGMLAYRVEGVVIWNRTLLVLSIVFAVGLCALALHRAGVAAGEPGEAARARSRGNAAALVVAGVLALAIAALHFTGMTAFQVVPLAIDGHFSNPAALHALALAVACMALVIAGSGCVSFLLDDSVRAESVEHLRTMAMSDMLTGLPNRANFNARIDAELARADDSRKLALIGIDLNRFKEINDLHGHHAGDEVLRILARRLASLVREDEFVARVGGDEFVAFTRFATRDELADLLERLETALYRPIRYDDAEVISGASLGVAIYPDDATSKTVLINNADLAMYRAKADLTQSVCFYEPAMDEIARERRSLTHDLREALARGQLSVHYQVQTSITTGDICGYEALLRWEHPRLGFISPAKFIPLAEENGLILGIGAWVLREACTRAVAWSPPYKVAVNLSPVQFAHADLPKLVETVLVETGLAPERLELELTETAIFADRERSLDVLQRIKAIGVNLALDDFGTGYSSLDTLRSFPFDKIKLDQSFVNEAETSRQATAIIRAVLALGKSLGIPVLAEGIETQDQLTLLANEGCDEVQGFLLGRPAPLSQIVASGQLSLLADDEPVVDVARP
ncbi:putative bifunctional diguanylate cyclase/phosphodiesterase [Paraburkholderia unamae]|uniref:Diguanylate cyclase/phosphodiesterase n=1 Tax=Paraburkholderia unamae TaxID=219649 RepID=A0ABX5KNR8_9BURK|nr:EAL domain-containing protein [Paraburkholderia unamae]PVX82678.1 diguanylate cyclase/phosphodiesterase [Paraburkholderia unamae]